MAGIAYIIWDNIPRGTQISCPHIERSCTTALYTDRKLGVSETVAAAASTIHLFTGNNIGPKGDLASRALRAYLEVDRPDPENRVFKHPDPVTWTEANRGQILAALYTLLLGNPELSKPINAPAKTRFKMWWRMVGAAIEHAASQYGEKLDFGTLFLSQEEDEEESASLSDALHACSCRWTKDWSATDLVKFLTETTRAMNEPKRKDGQGISQNNYVSDIDIELAQTLREFLFPHDPPNKAVSANSVGMRLKPYIGAPVRRGKQTLTLQSKTNSHTKKTTYSVEIKNDPA
jgi:hypothetical protein